MEPRPGIETNEGPQAERRFVDAMKKIIAVPREEMLRREAAYKVQSNLNPKRRGPKSKKQSTS